MPGGSGSACDIGRRSHAKLIATLTPGEHVRAAAALEDGNRRNDEQLGIPPDVLREAKDGGMQILLGSPASSALVRWTARSKRCV